MGISNTVNSIAEYKDGTWRQMGKLAKRRSHHLSIALKDDVMVIGGGSDSGSGSG